MRDQESRNFVGEDDDGENRTGTVMTATSHIITAVIGSGVLSLAWAMAQLGWVAGPAVLVAFSFITYYMATLLIDCNRSPGPQSGKRNPTYMHVVRAHLGGAKVQLCGLAQYASIVGTAIGYTITASISMVAVERATCFHKEGHDHTKCKINNYPYMIGFGIVQLVLSQIPNFHKLSWLSIVAAIMSFAYSTIGLGLSLARIISSGKHQPKSTLTGVEVGVDVTGADKVWQTFQAIGNIAFSYAFSLVLVEIQNTIKSPPPPENKVMKKASLYGVSVTTLFYALCGLLGYAAFGNKAPGNFLTGFGFYEPYWLVAFANICIAVHLIGAYQVYCQPLFGFIENYSSNRWSESKFISQEYNIGGGFNINMFRLVWRTVFVVLATLIAMIIPFFNDVLGLLGATVFYPLTVYFPIEMHIAQRKIPKFSAKWMWLKILSFSCLVVSLVAAAGSIQGIAKNVTKVKPFHAT
ncbi:hypothetical protein LIER_32079 [Lithospermum erythrorhizon]|uniref:Amino acid transporter transmembrane domain-containing protein n=1 Tax=Lithospermum erythrorhizon TaxID=34254 RepID=A0AAV3RSW1_LITER